MLKAIRAHDEANRPLTGQAQLQYEDWDFEHRAIEIEVPATGEIAFDDDPVQTSHLALMVPDRPQLWTACVRDFDQVDDLTCPTMQADGPSWWHELLGETLEDEQRGLGVRIGVVDMGFQPDNGLAHVDILARKEADHDAPRRRWSHGEAVCRILGDLSAPDACAPIAPGAELVFANASYTRETREDEDFVFPIAGAEATDYLDPRLVASAIFQLAFVSEVDLINLSLGSFDIDTSLGRGVTEAIQAAVDAGVTVICAAGNRFLERAAFPASLDLCVGVGAFGAEGWGPEGSVARLYAEEYPDDGYGELDEQTVFFWNESAHGQGVDVIGPGVGLLISRDGRPCFDLSGTSFAAPVVTGLLAVELARDSAYVSLERDDQRSAYARRRLLGLAKRTGMKRLFERAGAVTLKASDF